MRRRATARLRAARSRKPSSIPSKARKNATTSSITSEPTTLAMVRRNVRTATLATLQVGACRHHEQAEDAVVEETHQPAGRVEEVERVTRRWRVDDDEVEATFVVQLVQLLHRHVLLRAAERAGDVPVEAVVQDPFGLLGITRVAHHQPVERRLRVEHQRGQAAACGARPVVRQRLGSISLGVSDSCSSPSAFASRFAGSIVTTHGVATLPRAFERDDRGGRGLADAAAAAAHDDAAGRHDLGRCCSRSRVRFTAPGSRR